MSTKTTRSPAKDDKDAWPTCISEVATAQDIINFVEAERAVRRNATDAELAEMEPPLCLTTGADRSRQMRVVRQNQLQEHKVKIANAIRKALDYNPDFDAAPRHDDGIDTEIQWDEEEARWEDVAELEAYLPDAEQILAIAQRHKAKLAKPLADYEADPRRWAAWSFAATGKLNPPPLVGPIS